MLPHLPSSSIKHLSVTLQQMQASLLTTTNREKQNKALTTPMVSLSCRPRQVDTASCPSTGKRWTVAMLCTLWAQALLQTQPSQQNPAGIPIPTPPDREGSEKPIGRVGIKPGSSFQSCPQHLMVCLRRSHTPTQSAEEKKIYHTDMLG